MSGAIDGKPKCTRDPNGASARYQYHPDNTLRQLVNRSAAATVLTQHDYTYDSVGNRLKHIEKIGATTTVYDYAYDPLDRLTQVRNGTPAQQEDYAYDPLHNRTQKTVNLTTPSTLAYLYDAANQLKEIRQTNATGALLASLAYDLNGNLLSKTEGATTTSLAYDPLDQLTQVSKTGLSSQSYAYDDQGRRIKKTVGATITNYLYNGPDIVAEYAGSSTSPAALYAHGPNWDDPLIRLSGSSPVSPTATAQYYHADGLGSVVGLSTNQNTTTQTQRFDTWGNKLAGTIPPTAQYGYTGREPDETGLIYYRARYYDSTVGRFTQRDPIGLRGGINQYVYVANNPTNFTDPSGLVLETPWDAFNVGLGVYSLQDNVRSGNWGWAALDAVGLVYDSVATAVPFLPAGAGAGLTALRAGNSIVNSAQIGLDVARVANVANDAARTANVSANAASAGKAIHTQVHTAIKTGDVSLSASSVNHFWGANGATGKMPDLSWGDAGVWADLTTPTQWGKHVDDYAQGFGEGIPLFYKRGEGLVDTLRLRSGASTAAFGSQNLNSFVSGTSESPYSGSTTGFNPRLYK